MIKLITDSTCDLSEALIEQHDIDVIPLYVNIDEQSFKDGEELKTDAMYDLVEQTQAVPKTAAASPGEIFKTFNQYMHDDIDIIYTGIGAKFSATFQNAHIAKNMLDHPERVHLIDSQNLSSGSGLLLLKAAKMRDEGKPVKDIVASLEDIRTRVRTQFIIDTLEYLHKGGRLKSISKMVGTMLKVHPIIKVINGEMAIGKKPRGKMRKGIDVMIQDALKDSDNIDEDFMMITHSQAHSHVNHIREHMEVTGVKNIYETEAGCVISSHCGAGTIGILYIVKEDKKQT